MPDVISSSLELLHRVTNEYGWGQRDEILFALNTAVRTLKRAERYAVCGAILDLAQGNRERLEHYVQMATKDPDAVLSLIAMRGN